MAHVELSRAPEVHRKLPLDVSHFKFENGRHKHVPDSSNHSLFLVKLLGSSFPEKNAEGTSREMVRFVFRPSLSKHNERFARQYRCGPPPVSPDAGLLRLRSPSFQVLTFLVLLKPLSRSRNVHIHRYRHIYIYKLSLCSVMLCNVVLCGSVSVSVSLSFSSPSPLPPLHHP